MEDQIGPAKMRSMMSRAVGAADTNMELDDKVTAFRASIPSNLLAGDDFIDWQVIEEHLTATTSAVEHLQAFVDVGYVTEAGLVELLLEQPATYSLLLDPIAFNSSAPPVAKLPQLIKQGQGPHDVGREPAVPYEHRQDSSPR